MYSNEKVINKQTRQKQAFLFELEINWAYIMSYSRKADHVVVLDDMCNVSSSIKLFSYTSHANFDIKVHIYMCIYRHGKNYPMKGEFFR